MRDPKRIQHTLDLISLIWKAYPDLRFNQLICVLQREYASQNENYGLLKGVGPRGQEQGVFDFFNLEDDDFLAFLAAYAKKHKLNR